ncbi:ABC transporter permease [Salinivirga cyanobacteriivorans]
MALRHALNNRMYFFVNILGLVLGLTAVFLIGIYLNDELNFDRFHKDSDRIYRVIQFGNYGGLVERSSSCPFPLGPEIDDYFGEKITSHTRLYNYQSPSTQIAYRNIVHYDSGFFFTDPGFFEVFTVDTIDTKDEKWLEKPFQAVITSSAARKYFGHIDVVGKKLTIENHFQVEVQAVVEDWPVHSHFDFSVLVSLDSYAQMRGGALPTNWVQNPCWTYIKVSEQTNQSEIQKSLPAFVKSHFDAFIRDNNALFLQPLHDIHLTSHLEYEIRKNGNMEYVYIFGGVALFLILMAAINYINLTTATFASRAREIAIKKVLGATAGNIRFQLFIEAFIITLIAAIISLVFTELLLPWFNQITVKDFELLDLISWRNLVFFFLILVAVATAGGIYPAIFIAGLNPARILKGNLKRAGKTGVSRKVLVVSQLFISTLLVFAALTIHDQYKHLLRSSNGINRDNLFVINARFSDLYKSYPEFKKEIEKHDAIYKVTASDYIPGIDHNRHGFFIGSDTAVNDVVFLPALRVVSDFFEVYGLEITEGRGFANDSSDLLSAVLINPEMARHLGYEKPGNAIGADLNVYYGKEQVVGIFEDFYPKTLHDKPNPFAIDLVSEEKNPKIGIQYAAVRYKPGKKDQALMYIKRSLKRHAGDKQVQINEYRDIYYNQYAEEKLFNQLAGIMSVLSLIISAVGLLGLVSFMILQKNKEISVRKVHGASNSSILGLIAGEFIRIFIVVILFALPVAWYLSRLWLDNFASHVSFSLMNWIVAILTVALMIIIVAALRLREAARVNPAETLKYE